MLKVRRCDSIRRRLQVVRMAPITSDAELDNARTELSVCFLFHFKF